MTGHISTFLEANGQRRQAGGILELADLCSLAADAAEAAIETLSQALKNRPVEWADYFSVGGGGMHGAPTMTASPVRGFVSGPSPWEVSLANLHRATENLAVEIAALGIHIPLPRIALPVQCDTQLLSFFADAAAELRKASGTLRARESAQWLSVSEIRNRLRSQGRMAPAESQLRTKLLAALSPRLRGPKKVKTFAWDEVRPILVAAGYEAD